MAFNIQEFASNISDHGVIQTNKFIVTIQNQNFPNNLFNDTLGEQAWTFRNIFGILLDRIESVKLPGLLIDTVASARYGIGPNISSGTNVRFDPLSITILSDKEMSIHKFFIAWFNYVFNGMSGSRGSSTSTFLSNYKQEYATDITVEVYKNISQASASYRFFDAFPISISEPTLSWNSNNTLYRFDVNFLYTNWIEELQDRNVKLTNS